MLDGSYGADGRIAAIILYSMNSTRRIVHLRDPILHLLNRSGLETKLTIHSNLKYPYLLCAIFIVPKSSVNLINNLKCLAY